MRNLAKTIHFEQSHIALKEQIYVLWKKYNKKRHAFYILWLGLFVMAFMIGFDALIVQDPYPFVFARVVAVGVFLPALGLLHILSQLQFHVQNIFQSFLILLGPVIYHTQYLYYVFFHKHEKVDIYFIGLLIGLFCGSFIIHKFRIEQMVFNSFGIVTSLIVAILFEEKTDLVYIILVCNIGAIFMCIYFRRDFINNLYSTYSLLKVMVPAKVAQILVVSHETIAAQEHFKPRQHFAVCLCADWRNFQKIANTRSSNEVSEMLEKFYDNVLVYLERLIPTNNFYFSWTADELFIVFFNDQDDPKEVSRDALIFCQALVTEIFEAARHDCGHEICFDVGMASGIGLLGLQGPRQMKKTVITGEMPGRSKRFQEEAKRVRFELKSSGPPILILDQALYQFARETGILELANFYKHKAKTKDILDVECYLWQAGKSVNDALLKKLV